MKDQLCRSMGNEQVQWSRYNGEKVDGVSTPSSFFAGKAKKLPALCAGLALLAGAEAADAASLWWDKTRVHTASVRECLAIAHEAMQGLN